MSIQHYSAQQAKAKPNSLDEQLALLGEALTELPCLQDL